MSLGRLCREMVLSSLQASQEGAPRAAASSVAPRSTCACGRQFFRLPLRLFACRALLKSSSPPLTALAVQPVLCSSPSVAVVPILHPHPRAPCVRSQPFAPVPLTSSLPHLYPAQCQLSPVLPSVLQAPFRALGCLLLLLQSRSFPGQPGSAAPARGSSQAGVHPIHPSFCLGFGRQSCLRSSRIQQSRPRVFPSQSKAFWPWLMHVQNPKVKVAVVLLSFMMDTCQYPLPAVFQLIFRLPEIAPVADLHCLFPVLVGGDDEGADICH